MKRFSSSLEVEGAAWLRWEVDHTWSNTVSCKVMKRQHVNPEFDHKRGEIFKKTCKKKEKVTYYRSTVVKLRKPSIFVVN
jgi:hypothetical protein